MTPWQERSVEQFEGEAPALVRWLRAQLPDASGNAVKRLIESGKVEVEGEVETDPAARLRAGQRVRLRPEAPRLDKKREIFPQILHLDRFLVVAVKPSGILTLPLNEERDSLAERVRRAVPTLTHSAPIPPLLGVHRLDKEASGVVVMARTVACQRGLQDQFAEHTAERVYLAVVSGDLDFAGQRTVRSVLVADRGDGLKGSSDDEDAFGKEAVTHFSVLERYGEATLLACRLETGRTHQIRIHTAELGHPVAGEKVYVRDHRGPLVQASRLMLHATTLGLVHPMTGEALRYEAPPPVEMKQFIERLRAAARRARTRAGRARQGG